MMKLAIMQPYLFPYLGYFQLIYAVDTFLIYDDVNFIKGGWINRNYILFNRDRLRLTLPLKGASPNKLIKDISISRNHKILKTIYHAYSKAPQFANVYPLVEEIFRQKTDNLSEFLSKHLYILCAYLGIHPKWIIASETLEREEDIHGQDRVLSICRQLEAHHYINAPGGKNLYDASEFEKNGVELSFLRSRETVYSQSSPKFVPNLSIIDVMMFNDKSRCRQLLLEYDLVQS